MIVRELDLQTLRLERGAHRPDHTFCLLEAAAYVAGEEWTDAPACVSPAIAAFGRTWNDQLDDATRQRLKPYIPRIIGTNTGPADEARRAWLATDWLVRTFAPAWLDLATLPGEAAALRALPELASADLATSAMPTIQAARPAAWDADRALAPTVAALQESAFGLLDSLIEVGRVEPAA